MDFSLFSWKQFLMSWVNNIGPNVYKLFDIFESFQVPDPNGNCLLCFVLFSIFFCINFHIYRNCFLN